MTGASSGIGAAVAKELLALGYEVYGIGRSFSALPDSPQGCFHAVQLDLTKTGALAGQVQEIRREGRISLLVRRGCSPLLPPGRNPRCGKNCFLSYRDGCR